MARPPLSDWQRALVEQWRYLPRQLVTQALVSRPGFNREDLDSAANWGLVLAGQYYRPEDGEFSTYARPIILQNICLAMSRAHPVRVGEKAMRSARRGQLATRPARMADRILA